jgi:uncharacterized repeat protein (TIGR02543 family)
MIMRILRALFVIVSIFFANHLLYAADFYYLTTNNNIGASNATSPSTGTIGFLGETHPNFCYAPPNGYSCQYFRATLYALPPDGYVFKNWTGDVQGVTDTASWKITVTMDRNRTITANFVPARHFTATTRGYIHASPLLYDINQDGVKEIIIGDMAGYVYCFDNRGAKLWEYYAGNAFNKTISPVPDWFNVEARNNTSIGNITIQSGCAGGDVDGDGLPDIICGVGGFVDPDRPGGGKSTAFGPVGQGGILILNSDGTLKLLVRSLDTYDGVGNPILDGFSDGIYGTPALADLDSDGTLDFVVGGTDQNIHAFRIATRDTSRNSGDKKCDSTGCLERTGYGPSRSSSSTTMVTENSMRTPWALSTPSITPRSRMKTLTTAWMRMNSSGPSGLRTQ